MPHVPAPPPGEARDRFGRAASVMEAEERAKDAMSFRNGARRRTVCTLVLGPALFGARALGLTEVPPALLGAMFGAALLASALAMLVARRLATATVAWRHVLQPVFVLLDTALISAVVLVFGTPSLALLYLVAIVPYSFDRGRTIGWLATLASVAGYLLASWGHARLAPLHAAPWTTVLGTAALLATVALQIVPLPSRLIRRIRRTRAAMVRAEQGDLTAHVPARAHDELGYLQRGYNHMLDELAALLGTIQAEASEVVAAVHALDQAAGALERSGRTARDETEAMAQALEGQHREVTEAARRAAQAAEAAARLQQRASDAAAEARALAGASGTGREAVAQAASTLLEVGARVRESARAVDGLREAGARVGTLVATMSRLARQTNRVALNASIEAARAGDAGREFAIVADAMRRLAEESTQAARAAAGSVARARDEIDGVARLLDANEQAVHDVGDVAAGAVAAFERVEQGVTRIDRVTGDASGLAATQGATLRELASAVQGAGAAADHAAARALSAAQAMHRTGVATDEVTRTARALRALAARLHGAARLQRDADGRGTGAS